MIDLGTLRGLLHETSIAIDVNDARQVLGRSAVSTGYSDDWIPFLWEKGTMRSVRSLVDPSLGWTISAAPAINNRGQIAATAFKGTQWPHALLLTPPQ